MSTMSTDSPQAPTAVVGDTRAGDVAVSGGGLDGIDLADRSLYFSRELSWLDFNDRVLQLAEDPTSRCSSA